MACCGRRCDDIGPADRAEPSFFAPCATCPTVDVQLCWRCGGAILRVTLAAGADGQLGLVAPVAVVISPGYVGSVAGGPEVPEIVLPAVAPRVVAALRTKRLGRGRRARHGQGAGWRRSTVMDLFASSGARCR